MPAKSMTVLCLQEGGHECGQCLGDPVLVNLWNCWAFSLSEDRTGMHPVSLLGAHLHPGHFWRWLRAIIAAGFLRFCCQKEKRKKGNICGHPWGGMNELLLLSSKRQMGGWHELLW